MNHIADILHFQNGYVQMIGPLIDEVNAIKDPKHKAEKQRELEMIMHFVEKSINYVHDLNSWLTVFGPGSDDQ